ncbi:hypothetical protein [Cyclobacterium sp. SYSU L10401]|uniref:hypothetical protein n=1 Tax=Cyclobacterium sp. SYSU L10401 TaxID=2678657 RepID=UPI0013D7FAEA|nr:hypothetical protein [Cyclobacterium sp. SYSU L10401]
MPHALAAKKQSQILETRDILRLSLITGMIEVDALDLTAYERKDQDGMMAAEESESYKK